MQEQKIWEGLGSFSQKLQDEESRKLFEIKLDYLMYKNRDRFYEGLDAVLQKRKDNYSCWRLNQYYQRNPENREKSIVIFGAGENGKLTCRSLMYLNKRIDCLCDNKEKLWGSAYKEIPVCSPAYVAEKLKNSLIVIAVSEPYQIAIYHQLILAGFEEKNILIPQEGYLYCDRSGQYFDLEQLRPKDSGEYFVDAGCYDGTTSLQCLEWCEGNLKMIYAFEPDYGNYEKCATRLSLSGCEYELYEYAAWSRKRMLCFHVLEHAGYSSRVQKDGMGYVKADSIDNCLMGRKATYIKYDVEGSELEALKGSLETILCYRPRLAISLYHKPEDAVEIPLFLEGIDLGYRYYLRHYQTRMQETVLYAV